jgi:ABC-2 type transport system ATP-binding protein
MPLTLVDIDHRYGRAQSLRAVSMHVEAGDCYGFIGHNGAGKTTTLRIALGLDRPSTGRVLVDGFAIDEHPLEARARLGGMIEVTGFHPWASGRENLLELARLQGLERRHAAREAARWLEVVGLGGRGDSPVRTYSQGMRQRLGLAQALLGEPRYVLLDEPQNGLDPEGIAELREVLRRLTRDCGMTVVLSSHQLHELTGLCNRVGVLRQGRLLCEAPVDELLAATHGRIELGTDDPRRTDAVLARLGARRIDPERPELVELGEVPARDLVRELVAAGVEVDRVAPRPTTLEEVYLQLAAGAEAAAGNGPAVARPAAPAPAAPAERIAPRWPSLRMARYELRRNAKRWASALLVAIPAFLAWQRVAALAEDHHKHLADVASGKLFSTSTVTAFEALGRGLGAAIPAMVVMLVAVGSQSIAGELSLGTLRNVLLRPLRRVQVVAGKALALSVAVLVTQAAAVGAAWVAADAYFDFGDRFEVTRDGEPELWIEAIDVWPLVPELLLGPLLPLFAYALLGLAIGAVVRRAIWALSVALFAVLALDLGRAFGRRLGLEAWLPSTHLPSPFGGASFVDYYLDVAIGSAEAYFEHAATVTLAPLAWGLCAFAVAALAMARKRVE